VWEHGKLQVRPFWSITSDPANITVSVDEAAETLDAHLARAVELQMMSEVPLGTFCSGGVDSGLVSAHASRLSPHQLMTFSVGFEDPEWDESALAADTAKRFATDHHCVIARPEEFESLLSKLIWYHDEPLSHPNSVPLYVLSAFARKRVTVVLTGEGSDELFAGYPRYHIARLRGRLDPVPRHGLAVLGGIVGLLPGHKADRLASLLPLSFADSVIFNSAYADPSLVRALTGCDINDVIGHRRRMLEESFVPGDPLSTISRYELRTYLVCLLDRMDRMAMASGLEGRVPFLDVPLAEWALRLHSSLKLGLRENKRVVKRAAQGLLSPKITGGRKSGFGMPLDAWFRQREFARLVAKLQDPNHPATECLDYATVAKILREHTSGAADHGEVLWLIANVYLWHEVQGESRRQWAPPQAAAAVRV
jgi:asparagine synthase (glutamine-hydrolysing)